jgi:hypothetical protein
MTYRKIDADTVEVSKTTVTPYPTARYAEHRKMLVTQITQLQAELATVDAQIVSVKAVGCVVPSSEVVIGD